MKPRVLVTRVIPDEGLDPVREACEHWSKLHQDKRAPLLLYRDGRNYITIDDARFGEKRAEMQTITQACARNAMM